MAATMQGADGIVFPPDPVHPAKCDAKRLAATSVQLTRPDEAVIA